MGDLGNLLFTMSLNNRYYIYNPACILMHLICIVNIYTGKIFYFRIVFIKKKTVNVCAVNFLNFVSGICIVNFVKMVLKDFMVGILE